MQCARIIVTTAMLFWFVSAPLCLGRTEKVLSGRDLLRALRDKDENEKLDGIPGKETSPSVIIPDLTKKTASQSRVLHFPKDRSIGMLLVQDASISREVDSWSHWGTSGWENFCQAKGDVAIPTEKRLQLVINADGLKDLSALSALGPNDIYELRFQYSGPQAPQPGDECIPHLLHLTGLKVLHLKRTGVTNKGLRFVKKMKNLERLSLPERITVSGLKIISKCDSLKGLYFEDIRITDQGLSHIAELHLLKDLGFWNCHIDNTGLVHLAKLASLRYLLLGSTNLNDQGLAQLKSVNSLESLNIMHSNITDAGLVHLSKLKALEYLNLYNTHVTDEGLVHLKSMRFLKKLNIGKVGRQDQITDAGMMHLAQINSLEHLELPNVGITDKGLVSIAKLKNLRYLWVGGWSKSPLTDNALQNISKLDKLEFLLVRGTGFTDAGMDYLAKLTNLREITLGADLITNEGLARLRTLKSLESFELICKNVTIPGLSHLNALPNLVELKVHGCVQDNSGLGISGLTKLETFSLALDEFRDEDFPCFAKLKNLKRFQIGSTKNSMITDAGMAHIASLTEMERLTIGSPYLSDKTLSYLINMKQLNYLDITGDFTDKGLRHLEGLKNLTFLSITCEDALSNAALARLKQKLPNLVTLRVMP